MIRETTEVEASRCTLTSELPVTPLGGVLVDKKWTLCLLISNYHSVVWLDCILTLLGTHLKKQFVAIDRAVESILGKTGIPPPLFTFLREENATLSHSYPFFFFFT